MNLTYKKLRGFKFFIGLVTFIFFLGVFKEIISPRSPSHAIKKENKKTSPSSFESNKDLQNLRKKTKILPSFSVFKYGAKGDGITDDTQSIQKAIDAAHSAGGGVVAFSTGEYKIKIQPNKSIGLIVYSNIVLQGQGFQNTAIKLADSQGNYDSIIAGESFASDLSNLSFLDLSLDGNSQNNRVNSEEDFKTSKFRYGIRVFVGDNIDIHNCRFKNFQDANVITLNGTAVANIDIRNNRFEDIGGGSSDYDHSTIYILGKGSLIAQNTFASAAGPGTYGARTAIEIHGDEHQVLNNQISGYTFGMNVTGIASSSKNQRIEGNTITGAHTGIVIWSYLSEGQQSKLGLENVSIHQNQIDLDVMGWRKLWGDSPNQGIALEANSNASIKDLEISNNKIEFHNFQDAGRRTDSLSAGLALWRAKTPNVYSENITITQNEIRSPLASGVYISMPIQNLKMTKNKILNVGQGKYPFHPHYRSGLIVGGNSMSMQINQNQFIDDQVQPTLTVGMLWQGNCTQCTQQDNRVLASSGAKIPLLLQTP